MSRPPVPDSIDLFVSDLRRLWEDSGRIPFAALSSRSGVGKSSLNDAVKRTDQLPSERTLRALVGVLDPASADRWVERRSALKERRADRGSPIVTSSSRSRFRVPLVAAIVVVVAAASFAAGRFTRPEIRRDADTRSVAARDGADPIPTGCVGDANTVAAHNEPGIGVLRLIYSTRCNAYWAKIERSDGRSLGNRMEVAVVDRSDASRTQKSVEPDVTGAYTFLLRRDDPSVRYCAEGSIWTDRQRLDFDPVC